MAAAGISGPAPGIVGVDRVRARVPIHRKPLSVVVHRPTPSGAAASSGRNHSVKNGVTIRQALEFIHAGSSDIGSGMLVTG